VFDAKRTSQFKRGKGIQHYLKGEMTLHALLDDVAIDVFGEEGPLSMFAVPTGAALTYFPASTKVAQVDSRSPQVNERMAALKASLSRNTEFLLIDAASGIRDTYSIASEISDEMYMFFRWSTQHVEGTILMAQYMRALREFGRTASSFQLVASATPGESELESLDERGRQGLIELRDHTRKRIEAELRECMVEPPEIFQDIPEMVVLKWRESVIVFSQEGTAYEKMAEKILNSGAARAAYV